MSEHAEKHGKSGGSHRHGGAHGGGGGSHEEHEGAPEWLISFADNVTLMMGFFVILLAFNMGPKGTTESENRTTGPDGGAPTDFLDAAISIREAFKNPVTPNSMDPNDQILVRRLLERRGKSFVMDDGPPGDEHEVQSLNLDDKDGLCGLVHFAEKSAAVDDAARTTIGETAAHMRGVRLWIEVRGHVSAAEAYHLPDRGMQLAFDRALAVAELLCENGLEWGNLRVVSCADNERLSEKAYDSADHARNARVEIVQTDRIVGDTKNRAR